MQTTACNNGTSGYTERIVVYSTHLTEPQGKTKKDG